MNPGEEFQRCRMAVPDRISGPVPAGPHPDALVDSDSDSGGTGEHGRFH